MDQYDANQAPSPDAWNALEEMEQIRLVEDYHENEEIKLPDPLIHAGLHVFVENHAAMNEETAVSATINRLVADGLSRHVTIHAIAAVFTEHMHNVMSGASSGFSDEDFTNDIEGLTVEKIKEMAEKMA